MDTYPTSYGGDHARVNEAEAIHVQVIVTRPDGSKVTLESYDFDYVDFETRNKPHYSMWQDYRRALPPQKRDVIITLGNVGAYTVRDPKMAPQIEDGDILDEG